MILNPPRFDPCSSTTSGDSAFSTRPVTIVLELLYIIIGGLIIGSFCACFESELYRMYL